MTVIAPKREDIEQPRLKKNSGSLRLWHWLNALVITGSLLTVLLNSTLFDTKTNASFISQNLHENGVQLTAEQAKSVAHAQRDQVWEVHTYFGYVLAALLLFRLLLEVFQLADQKFIRKIKTAYRKYFITKQQRELALHELTVKTLYAIFYILILIMVATGLYLAFEDHIFFLKKIHAIKEVHGFTMYLIIAFIVLHIAGVLWAERKDGAGIVSDMINGGASE
ncbi:MAG: cytochrome b/b6 domain-containing protein [Janthinobacterium lividum]